MAINDSSATYSSPCAHREKVLHSSVLTTHHLLHTCLYVRHIVLDTASGKAGCDSQTDICPDVGSITVGEIPCPQIILRATLSLLPSLRPTIHSINGKDLQDKAGGSCHHHAGAPARCCSHVGQGPAHALQFTAPSAFLSS